MSVRNTGTNNYFRRESNLPAWSAYTVSGWFRRTGIVSGGSYDGVIGFNDGTTANWAAIYWSNAGASQWDLWYNGGGVGDTFVTLSGTPANDTWYYLFLKGNASNPRGGYLPFGASSFTSVVGVSRTMTGSPAFASWTHPLVYNESINGVCAHPRMWDAELTEDELVLEAYSTLPVRLANLNIAFRDISSTSITDLSINERNASIVGTLPTTLEDDPPISALQYPRWPGLIVPAAGGGPGAPIAWLRAS